MFDFIKDPNSADVMIITADSMNHAVIHSGKLHGKKDA